MKTISLRVKPSQDSTNVNHTRFESIRKLIELCPVKEQCQPNDEQLKSKERVHTRQHRVDLIVIGVSIGGPEALMQLLPELPSDFPVPVIVVQHMAPVFTKYFSERLQLVCPLRVAEAVNGAPLEAGTIWIAPGDYHVEIEPGKVGFQLRLHQSPPENSCRPSVDPTFRSASECLGSNVLGVIMTGMGSDGLQGAYAIRNAGGQIIVQDQASCVIWGMPSRIVDHQLHNEVVPLGELALNIKQRVSIGRKKAY